MSRIITETFEHGRVIFGDALEVLPTLDTVDAVVTDPPYSSGGMVRGDRMQSTRSKYQTSGDLAEEHPEFSGDNRDQRGFLAWASLWLMYAMDITVPGGMLAMFSDWRQLPIASDAMQAGGWVWRGIVPWDKENARPVPNRFRSQCEFVLWGSNGARAMDMRDPSAVYLPGIVRGQPPKQREHSTQKPVDVVASLCEVAPVGATILDPFLGSGTTALAALKMRRRYVGIEKDARIFSRACRRIEAAENQARLQFHDAQPAAPGAVPATAQLFEPAPLLPNPPRPAPPTMTRVG